MSAFMCSNDHLRVISIAAEHGLPPKPDQYTAAAYYRSHGQGRAIEHEAAQESDDMAAATIHEGARPELRAVAQLYAANEHAMQDRYGDAPLSTPPTICASDFDRLAPTLANPIAVIKLAHSYEYQACEWAQWEGSAAQQIVRRAIDRAARALPGYSRAPWSLSEIPPTEDHTIRLT